jgi:hypothetical protein
LGRVRLGDARRVQINCRMGEDTLLDMLIDTPDVITQSRHFRSAADITLRWATLRGRARLSRRSSWLGPIRKGHPFWKRGALTVPTASNGRRPGADGAEQGGDRN